MKRKTIYTGLAVLYLMTLSVPPVELYPEGLHMRVLVTQVLVLAGREKHA